MKFRSGYQKQQVSHFGANYNYDQECKHDDAIHGTEVETMLNAMQKESYNSDVRWRRNRRPKFQQINSFQQV